MRSLRLLPILLLLTPSLVSAQTTNSRTQDGLGNRIDSTITTPIVGMRGFVSYPVITGIQPITATALPLPTGAATLTATQDIEAAIREAQGIGGTSPFLVKGAGAAGAASDGVITVQGIASMTPVLVTLSGTNNLSGNQAVNVSQINGVTPLMGAGNTGTGSPRVTIATDQAALPVTPPPTTLSRRISAGTTEDEWQVKATAGVLVSLSATNAHATTDAFLKCSNLTAANTTPGTSAVFYSLMIPARLSVVDADINATFSTALTCYIVTGKADTDVVEVAADDVHVNLRYR